VWHLLAAGMATALDADATVSFYPTATGGVHSSTSLEAT